MSGLTDYLENYTTVLEKNNKKHNPIEPEDFIKYINDDIEEKGKYNYSNTGLLLCGLSIKYLYNKKMKEYKSYNNILEEYIIKPGNLHTFSINKPNKAVINDNIINYVNGSPAGGYWISSDDLKKFGIFILQQIKEKPKIHKYLKKFGKEFYYKNIISHYGQLGNSSCWLVVYIKYNISISIMDNNGKDSSELKYAIDYFI